MAKPRKPPTCGREARAAFERDEEERFEVSPGRGSHVKVHLRHTGQLVCVFTEHPRGFSPGVRRHVSKVLLRYGLLAALLLGLAAWWL